MENENKTEKIFIRELKYEYLIPYLSLTKGGLCSKILHYDRNREFSLNYMNLMENAASIMFPKIDEILLDINQDIDKIIECFKEPEFKEYKFCGERLKSELRRFNYESKDFNRLYNKNRFPELKFIRYHAIVGEIVSRIENFHSIAGYTVLEERIGKRVEEIKLIENSKKICNVIKNTILEQCPGIYISKPICPYK